MRGGLPGANSGPLFDRIDLRVEALSVSASQLTLAAARVAVAVQSARYAGEDGNTRLRANAEADGTLLGQAVECIRLTARGYHRVLCVARTLADLDGQAQVRRIHVAEALSYQRAAPGRR